MDKIVTMWSKMPTGKKIYSILWILFAVMLITTVLVVSFKTQIGNSNAVAAVALIFVLIMMAAIFTTVFVNSRLKKEKKGGK
ncbi:hypothetical protein MCRO_0269 [Mycoplasma crocodyli MP145]|uniref:Uncharacterized protein n=1 Tax=Mycoplasma crocodyli (strain ATCC 51981 / MP145) TaxID=512564 RepID=D5E578_MYCCM|nr:hypothetical protein MCRO_0269 [Mycoplasma crocodyli MP145]